MRDGRRQHTPVSWFRHGAGSLIRVNFSRSSGRLVNLWLDGHRRLCEHPGSGLRRAQMATGGPPQIRLISRQQEGT
jgi:hypothetical protein